MVERKRAGGSIAEAPSKRVKTDALDNAIHPESPNEKATDGSGENGLENTKPDTKNHENEHENGNGDFGLEKDEDGDIFQDTLNGDEDAGLHVSVDGKEEKTDKNYENENENENENDDDDEDEEEEEAKDDDDDDEEEKRRITVFNFDGIEYSFKERPSVLEEREGKIEFRVVNNDNTRENMIVLTGLKNIFQKQLPKMPREYILRLVYDRSHLSMAVVRKPLTVVGGITYRPFDSRGFAEIVFCAISSTEQVRGYGAHLMNHLKDYVRATSPVKYFLTYADNYAIGYFKKQGFTKDVSLDKLVWVGYIKDYEGGTLMQCSMLPSRLRYLDSGKILLLQKAAIEKKIKMRSQSHVVRLGLQVFKNAKPGFKLLASEIPGLVEAGWLEEMDKLAQKPKRGPHYNFMVTLLSELTNHPLAWPFAVPVNKDEVGDYYDVIKEPMDLLTMELKLENDKYEAFDQFLYDCKLIFNNCRSYNAETTTYYKNATKLEKFLLKKVKESPDYAHYLDL